MPTNIRIIHAHEFLKVTPEGWLDFGRSKELLIAVAAITAPLVNQEIILDTRTVQSEMFSTDLYKLVTELGNYRKAFSQKIAVLCPLQRLSQADFFEYCAKDRGFQVKAFTSYEEAVDWLAALQEHPDSKPAVPATPVAKTEVKPGVANVEMTPAVKSTDATANTPVPQPIVKAENRQASKGLTHQSFNAKIFGANYQSVNWGHGQAQRPKH